MNEMGTSNIILEKIKLSLVNPTLIKDIFAKLGIITKSEDCSGDELIYLSQEDLKENNPVECEGCGKIIKLSDFGHLVHGSRLFYCKNPYCFNHYLANQKMR